MNTLSTAIGRGLLKTLKELRAAYEEYLVRRCRRRSPHADV